LIAYFIRNISAKKISKSVHMYESYSKPKVGRFVCFSALTLVVGWQEGHLAHKNPIPLMLRGSAGTDGG